MWGLLFERLHHNTEFDALTTALTLQDWEAFGKPDIETSNISNFLNETLDHADTILILRETEDGGVKGSLRSRGRDVAALAENTVVAGTNSLRVLKSTTHILSFPTDSGVFFAVRSPKFSVHRRTSSTKMTT